MRKTYCTSVAAWARIYIELEATGMPNMVIGILQKENAPHQVLPDGQ
jgi:hypothetical protein